MATVTYSWRNTVPAFQMDTLNTTGNQRDPAIGAYGDGYIAAWVNPPSNGGYRFKTSSYGSGEVQLTSEIEPAFSRLTDGRSVHSYTDVGAGPGSEIHVIDRLNGFLSDTPISTGASDDRDSDIAGLADGGYVVTWTRGFGNGDADIRAAVMNADGSFRAGGPVNSGGLFVSNVSSSISSTDSSVAAYAGGFVVAWTERPVGGGASSIHYRRYAANGVPIDASHMLLDGDGSENEDVQVIGLADGGYAFAYEDNNWGTGTTDITFWIFNADGTSRTVIRANTNAGDDEENPTLAVLDNGYIVVGWYEFSPDQVRYQAFTPAGVMVGEETTVANSADSMVEILGLANGLVVNVHTSNISDGDGDSIRSSTDQFVRTTTGDATGETLYGDSFLDVMLGNGGNDSLVGLAGDDELSGHAGGDFLFGAGFAANGSFLPGSGNDTLDGGAENDGLWGGDGNDKLNGGTGNDGMCGGAGDDELNGGDNGDFLFGGDFSVFDGSRLPGSGKDTLNGDGGNDALYGFDDDDKINGGAGNDYVEAGEGADVINGGSENDTLLGQAGTDTLSGGTGFDYLYGGSGADTFVFGVGDSYDTAWDFSIGEEDKLRLDPGFGVANLAAFKARAVTFVFDGKNYTQFTSTDGADQITLAGVRPDQLTAANFEIL